RSGGTPIRRPHWTEGSAMAITSAPPSATTSPVTSPTPTAQFDADKLMSFVFRVVGEVGAALNSALVVMGDQLGYYQALAERGPLTAQQLARATATDQHYASEWLNAQAAGDYIDYDP